MRRVQSPRAYADEDTSSCSAGSRCPAGRTSAAHLAEMQHRPYLQGGPCTGYCCREPAVTPTLLWCELRAAPRGQGARLGLLRGCCGGGGRDRNQAPFPPRRDPCAQQSRARPWDPGRGELKEPTWQYERLYRRITESLGLEKPTGSRL